MLTVSTWLTRKYVCKASSKLKGIWPVLVTISSSRRDFPMDSLCTRRNACGHQRCVNSSLSVEQMTTAESPSIFTDSSCHSFVRTTPWAGAEESLAFERNQGKQTGIPPRIARPSCQFECSLTKTTSSVCTGCHDVSWAPCK